MPRANRYFLPGRVYHLTHRCHNREFLLRFGKDRQAYRKKLRQHAAASEVTVLDYCVTCNHVHLLVFSEEAGLISRFMQAVQGEFAQAYNWRKGRTGAYWSDRFHSTLVEPGGHLERCMVYVGLNMVRCGVVSHPREWEWCGYSELMGLRQRYRLLNQERVLELLGCSAVSDFRRNYEAMILERIARDQMKRDPKWTEAIAVGSRDFVHQAESRIKGRRHLEIVSDQGDWVLKEVESPYSVRGQEGDCGFPAGRSIA